MNGRVRLSNVRSGCMAQSQYSFRDFHRCLFESRSTIFRTWQRMYTTCRSVVIGSASSDVSLRMMSGVIVSIVLPGVGFREESVPAAVVVGDALWVNRVWRRALGAF